MKKIKTNKKGGGFFAEIIPQVFSYLALILILLIFFMLFNIKGCSNTGTQKITSQKTTYLDTDNIVLNFLKTPVEFDGATTIADILSIIDVEEGEKEKTKIFQETAKNIFEEFYLPYDAHKGKTRGEKSFTWWIKVHAEKEEPDADPVGDGKYMGGIKVPGKGYQYSTGGYCNPEGGQYSDKVTTAIVPKINGGYVKVIFCIYE